MRSLIAILLTTALLVGLAFLLDAGINAMSLNLLAAFTIGMIVMAVEDALLTVKGVGGDGE